MILAKIREFSSREHAEERARELIRLWNIYLSNQVYTIVVEYFDKDKKSTEYYTLGNHYGKEYVEQEIESMIK